MDVLGLVGSQPVLGSHDQFGADFDVFGELSFQSGLWVGDFEYLAKDVDDGEANFLGGKGGRNEGVHQAHLQ
jgi:hypothetical protein